MNARIISTTFQQMIGLPCWGLNYERLLNLSLNFGEPHLRIREPFVTNSKLEAVQRLAAKRKVTVKGEWWLWTRLSHWQLMSHGEELARSSSSLHRIEKAQLQLSGQKLVTVEIQPTTGRTRFAFDLGCVLDCRRMDKDSDSDLWLLYKPNRFVLAVRGDGTFSHHRGSTRYSDQKHHPLPIGLPLVVTCGE